MPRTLACSLESMAFLQTRGGSSRRGFRCMCSSRLGFIEFAGVMATKYAMYASLLLGIHGISSSRGVGHRVVDFPCLWAGCSVGRFAVGR